MARFHDLGGLSRPSRARFIILLAALLAASPARGASTTILITEVEADPVTIGADTPGEWLELTNIAAQAVVLDGWTITDDQSSDVLPTFALAAGECIVLAADTTVFRAAHPGYAGRLVRVGSIGTGLANLGDVITLRDDGKTLVDCVSWGTNTSCMSPAPAVPAANSVATLQRATLADTDASGDWVIANETPCPGIVGVGDRPPSGTSPTFSITPNPCFGRATITCSGDSDASLLVSIHDVAGRRVRTFRDATPGPTRSFTWDGLDERGREVPAGVYLVKVEPESGKNQSGRVLLLR
jgi:hypothetical protein